MKKIIFSLGAFLMLLHWNSQNSVAQIHIKSLQGVGLEGGVSDLGTQFSLYYSKFLTRKIYAGTGLGYESGQVKNNLKYQAYSLQLRANYTLFDLKESFFISAGMRALVGRERVGGIKFSEEKAGESSGIILQIGLGGELEYYLNEKWALLLNGYQDFKFKGLGNSLFHISTGLRYFFH